MTRRPAGLVRTTADDLRIRLRRGGPEAPTRSRVVRNGPILDRALRNGLRPGVLQSAAKQ